MLNKKIGLLALFAGLAASEVMAGTLTNYTTGDILLCFRNGATRNLVVDVGPYSTLAAGTPNQRIPITQYTTGQIATAFGDANGLSWSAFSSLGDGTLFVTKKRVDLNIQSTTPNAANAGLQTSAAQNMGPVPAGANYQYSGVNAPNSTQTAVNEPQADSSYPAQNGKSYNSALFGTGSFPTFQGTLPSGDPEVATPGDFTSSGTVVRNDLYQIPPGIGKSGVIYLGYFEINPSGAMTFVAKPSTVPVFNSISRSNTVSVISYSTGLYGTYTLRGTNTLSSGVPATNWPAISILTSGATTSGTYLDADASPNKFYIITVQ